MPDARKPLISGNWKMHHTHLDAIQVVQKLHFRIDPNTYDRVDVSVHPAFTALRSVQTLIQSDRVPILLGAQNCHTDAQAVCGLIRATVRERWGDEAAGGLRIQYGGSVKPANIAELMAEADIDGALVGGASLDPDEFAAVAMYDTH